MTLRDGAKFMGDTGRVYRQGGIDFFQKKKWGANTFFERKKRGRRFFCEIKKGDNNFFEIKKWGALTFFLFQNSNEPKYQLSKNADL